MTVISTNVSTIRRTNGTDRKNGRISTCHRRSISVELVSAIEKVAVKSEKVSSFLAWLDLAIVNVSLVSDAVDVVVAGDDNDDNGRSWIRPICV